MVVFVLYVKADLTGVASLALAPGKDLCISVRNPVDHVEKREKIVIETVELALPPEGGGKHSHDSHPDPPCHFSLKWDGVPQRATIRVLRELPNSNKKFKGKGSHGNSDSMPTDMTAKDSGNFVPMLALECLGLEPYAFHPMGSEFVVTNKAGDIFESVDLSKGLWSEFELSSGSTTISNFETKFD
jgi:hypothetical protein